jgi:hypothetical protein
MATNRPLITNPFAKEGDREFVRMVVAWGATVSPAIRADVLRMADLIKQMDEPFLPPVETDGLA